MKPPILRPQPFVGLCGVYSATEYAHLLSAARHATAGSDRFVMLGLKRALPGGTVLSREQALRPFMHCTLKDGEPFEQLVDRVLAISESYVRGLQLNVLPWMEVDFAPLWCRLKVQFPALSLVLQAHAAIMENYSPAQIAERLRGLAVDYILFDISQSRGLPYDLAHMRTYVDAIYQRDLPYGVVVAGGLSAVTLPQIFQPLLADYPALSCDAFGSLRHTDSRGFSWPAVAGYLHAWRRANAREF